VFVGPMAAGKTSIGKLVAAELNVPFIDTDSEIANQYGSITEIFSSQGEESFRRIEERIVSETLQASSPCVVSLGGGAVTSQMTRDLLRNHTVILLMTTEQSVLSRANLSKRPLLKADPSAWARLLVERMPFYEEVAQKTFDTSRIPKAQSVKEILSWLKEEGKS